MTFQELYEWLGQLSEDDRRNHDAMVYHEGMDEYYPVTKTSIVPETDILDKGHPVIEF